MVKSTENYELWKEETREHYLKKFPNKDKYINGFMDYISTLYDKHQRAYMPKKVMWYLYEKRLWVIRRNQHFWIAFIGKKGGEGKTTLCGHVLHFMDGSYDKKRIAMNYDQFIRNIRTAKKINKYPSVSLDEPETKIHQLSKKGTTIRDILERVRQLNLFVGVCCNSLSSIPPFIYERLSAIVYLNDKHRWWLWDNAKDNPLGTVVDDIKGEYGWKKYKHATFKKSEFIRRAYFKNLTYSQFLPYDTTQYLKEKEDDLLGLLDTYINKNKTDLIIKNRLKGKEERLIKEIIDLKKRYPKLSDRMIGLRLGLSRKWVNHLRNKAGKCE